MPTLLWRVLHLVGYLEGREPCYYWSEGQPVVEDRVLTYVDIVVPTRGDGSS